MRFNRLIKLIINNLIKCHNQSYVLRLQLPFYMQLLHKTASSLNLISHSNQIKQEQCWQINLFFLNNITYNFVKKRVIPPFINCVSFVGMKSLTKTASEMHVYFSVTYKPSLIRSSQGILMIFPTPVLIACVILLN